MGSEEQNVSICFTTLPAYAGRLRTLNEIALPIVPTGTTPSARADSNSSWFTLFYAVAAIILEAPAAEAFSHPNRNSAPSIHIRWRMVASLRATATRALAMPRRLATAMPQARKLDHFLLLTRSECAAS